MNVNMTLGKWMALVLGLIAMIFIFVPGLQLKGLTILFALGMGAVIFS